MHSYFASVYLNTGIHWCLCNKMNVHPSQVLGLHQPKNPDRNWVPNPWWELMTLQSTSRRKESFILYFQRRLLCLASHIWHSACPTRKEQLPVFFLAFKMEGIWMDMSVECRLSASRNSQNYWDTLYPQKGLCSLAVGELWGSRFFTEVSKQSLSLSINIICTCALSAQKHWLTSPSGFPNNEGSCSLRSSCGSCQRGKGLLKKWKVSGNSLMWKVNR